MDYRPFVPLNVRARPFFVVPFNFPSEKYVTCRVYFVQEKKKEKKMVLLVENNEYMYTQVCKSEESQVVKFQFVQGAINNNHQCPITTFPSDRSAFWENC